MKQVTQEQDYSVRVPGSGTDEIAELSKGFNNMLEQIQKRDASLIEARNSLEIKVQERTKELQERSKELDERGKALLRSNKALEQFAYVASHDLQEPLRMIGSFSQLLARRYSVHIDQEMSEYIYYIVDGVSRMQQLIRDLLEFSRIGTRKMDIKDVNMEDVMLKCLSNVRYSIEESNASVTYDEMPTVACDSTKMVQLFQNLVSNAIKFRDEKPPKVHISVLDLTDKWQFTVSDNGIGIDPEYQEKIFLIFQRLHTNEYPGTGIGLAICKKIVEIHGGEIWLDSKLGKGTNFHFTLRKSNQALMKDNNNGAITDKNLIYNTINQQNGISKNGANASLNITNANAVGVNVNDNSIVVSVGEAA